MDAQAAFVGALIAFAATSLGALGALFIRKPNRELLLCIMAMAAGVMAYSSIEMFLQANAAAGAGIALFGLGIGIACFIALEKIIPHVHAYIRKERISDEKKKTALIVGTVTLHNIPEGFAIASAFAASPALGWLVTSSISLQDIPEGLVVAAPLQAYGIKTNHSVLFGIFSGFVEFAAAIFGIIFLEAVVAATPLALSFSAGAMGFVTVSELLPDSFSGKDKLRPALSLIAGFALAFVLSMLLAPKL